MEYPKINTLFKRDKRKIIIPDEFTDSVFYYLRNNKWECTEKIDGTNIRIMIDWYSQDEWHISYKGRTDRAEIPGHLLEKLNNHFDDIPVNELFEFKEPMQIILYGEGYGYKIQKGHNYIPKDVDFILFDVKIGKWWLNRSSIKDIANSLDIRLVPLIGYMDIFEAIEYVKKGFKSTIAHNEDYDAEGLVLKTPNGLLYRNGQRIITKIKTVDFVKYKEKRI